ncbi:MAG: hypothetical protein QOE70_3329 [Chthoniobacter sp.]|jgi:hypothetical protein|nr:hypothetical protein [Chthoniobacter sp.]
MAPDRLREALRALPFQPFTVEIAGGKRVRVKHSDYAYLSPAGRTLAVYGDDDEWLEMIDVFLITNLSFGRARSTRRR